MPLRSPGKLPRRFRRTAGPSAWAAAQKYFNGTDRRRLRRRERRSRIVRRLLQWRTFIVTEGRLWLIIGVTAVSLTVLLVLLLAPFFDVRMIRVQRQDPRIDRDDVQQVLAPLLSQRLVLVTLRDVRSLLEPAYPDLESVRIQKTYPSTLTVSIQLQPVVARISIEDARAPESGSGSSTTGSGTTYYYVTGQGTFIASPLRLTTAPVPTLTLVDWVVLPQNRSSLLSPDFLKTIFLARDILRRDFGLSAEKMTLYLRAQEFHIRTPKATLWFDLRSTLPVQFGRFRSFLRAVGFDQVKEYIDLRITDKIVYR